MTYSVGLQLADCTIITVPGWAALLVVAIAASPRLASRLIDQRSS